MIDEKFSKRVETKWQKLYQTNDDVLNTLISMLHDESQWDFNYGCPIGNLFQESLSYDQDFSRHLGTVLDTWQEQFRLILEKAKLEKQLREDVDTQEVAMFIIAGIEGSLVMNKKSNDPQYFHKCMKQLTLYLNTLRA